VLLGIPLRPARHFDYGTHTHSGPAFNPVRLYLTRHRGRPADRPERSHNPDHATPAGYHTWLGLACSAFARHYLRNHGCFLFLWVLRCFTSPRSLYPPYTFRRESPGHHEGPGGVSPFGNPRITARLSAPRGLSQITTSFFGSRCQGIHRLLLET
jgi:hypothetical protein